MLLGDNWYGPLDGGAQSARWQTQFEEMYPPSVFDCPAYAILGNHDYQKMPVSKLDAEIEYARSARPGGKPTRFTMPSRWYRFEFPAKDPLITFIALDSNMPKAKKNDVDFTLTEQDAAEQVAWLEGELKQSANDAVSGGDGASPRVFGWAAWGPSCLDTGLGPAVSQVQRFGLPGWARSRHAAPGVCWASDELLFVGRGWGRFVQPQDRRVAARALCAEGLWVQPSFGDAKAVDVAAFGSGRTVASCLHEDASGGSFDPDLALLAGR